MCLEIGNLVSGSSLNSGSGYYDCAVVVSLDPFILISKSGDMRWTCLTKESVKYIGEDASKAVLRIAFERLLGDYNDDESDFYLGPNEAPIINACTYAREWLESNPATYKEKFETLFQFMQTVGESVSDYKPYPDYHILLNECTLISISIEPDMYSVQVQLNSHDHQFYLKQDALYISEIRIFREILTL